MPELQVSATHYEFEAYMPKRRWASVWHQVMEVERFAPNTILELGPGPGVFRKLMSSSERSVVTVDLDRELLPTVIASGSDLPFSDRSFDVTCAFQVLEHAPFAVSVQMFRELERLANTAVVISLPDAAPQWPYEFYIPRLGSRRFSFNRPKLRPRRHTFDGQHHWELNTAGFPVERIVEEFPVRLVLDRSFRVPELPYHRFLVFTDRNQSYGTAARGGDI